MLIFHIDDWHNDATARTVYVNEMDQPVDIFENCIGFFLWIKDCTKKKSTNCSRVISYKIAQNSTFSFILLLPPECVWVIVRAKLVRIWQLYMKWFFQLVGVFLDLKKDMIQEWCSAMPSHAEIRKFPSISPRFSRKFRPHVARHTKVCCIQCKSSGNWEESRGLQNDFELFYIRKKRLWKSHAKQFFQRFHQARNVRFNGQY